MDIDHNKNALSIYFKKNDGLFRIGSRQLSRISGNAPEFIHDCCPLCMIYDPYSYVSLSKTKMELDYDECFGGCRKDGFFDKVDRIEDRGCWRLRGWKGKSRKGLKMVVLDENDWTITTGLVNPEDQTHFMIQVDIRS